MFEKVIIHVGLHKTGTTSLQKYFGDNKKKLKSLGIIYPKLSINDFTPNNHSWPILNLTLSDPSKYHLNITNRFSGARLDSIVTSINQQFLELKDTKEKVLLISGEGISTLKKAELEVLKNKLYEISYEQVNFEIHYFTRNVNQYISSVMQERLKGGTRESIILSELARTSPFDSFLNLKVFETVFYKNTIKAHSYEEACQYSGGLEAYFSKEILMLDKHFNIDANRTNTRLSSISFQLISYYVSHSKKYVRVPIQGTNYSENIKKLSEVKGDKFSLTVEHKNHLIKLINDMLNSTKWRLFFKDTELKSEKSCWSNIELESLEKQLKFLDKECQQILVDFFRDMAVKLENDNIKLSFSLMSLAYKYRPTGKFISNKIKEYNLKLNESILNES